MGAAAQQVPRRARRLDDAPAPKPVSAVSIPDPRDPIYSRVYIRALSKSLALFSHDVLKLEISPHVVEWCALIEENPRVSIQAARGHGKSTVVSYAYPIWRAWSEPGCEVYIFSATTDQARDLLDVIIYGNQGLRGLVDIPELQHLVPGRHVEGVANDNAHNPKDPRYRLNRSDVRLTNGSRIRAIGFGKRIRGRHPKYIVADDVLNDDDLFSETVREKHKHYFFSAISQLVDPQGQILVIGTPMHSSDLLGVLHENPEYAARKYPGILTDPNTGEERALFPWRFTLEILKKKRVEIGSIAFAREIMLVPISDDFSLFPSYLFPPLFDKEMTLRPTPEQIRARGWSTYMGVDIALSASVGADYFVLFIIGVDPKNGQHYIVDIRRHKGLPFREQLSEIETWAKYYDCSLVFIESNQAQRVWSDEMKRSTDVPVKEFVTTAQNKYPLDKGIPSLRILLENKKITIPRGDAYSVEKTNIWINEMVPFAFVEGKAKSTATHDDTALAFWIAVEAKKAGGFSFSGGADEDDEDAMKEMMGEGTDGEDWMSVMIGGEDGEAADAFGM